MRAVGLSTLEDWMCSLSVFSSLNLWLLLKFETLARGRGVCVYKILERTSSHSDYFRAVGKVNTHCVTCGHISVLF